MTSHRSTHVQSTLSISGIINGNAWTGYDAGFDNAALELVLVLVAHILIREGSFFDVMLG
jgi:hypothetical protein